MASLRTPEDWRNSVQGTSSVLALTHPASQVTIVKSTTRCVMPNDDGYTRRKHP